MAQTKATRDGFGEALVELGRENDRVVVLSGDLEDSTRAEYFKKEFPDRFFNVGISEQDMIGMAAGLAAGGFIPFACSFAVFGTNRPYDQIRITVCYNERNVKIVGSHSGITVGPDGATAQALEDIAIMRVLPNMTVVYPVDAIQAKKATRAIAEMVGPAYLRLSRNKLPVITNESDAFELGKADVMKEGKDVTVIACGLMVSEALSAAEKLAKEDLSVEVINVHTIKPLDTSCIIESAKKTGTVVTAEEHQINAGLGGAVAEVLVRNVPVPVEMVAVRDTFGESGESEELLEKYHLTEMDIIHSIRNVLKRK